MKASSAPAEVRVIEPKLALPVNEPVIREEPSVRAVMPLMLSLPDPPALVSQAKLPSAFSLAM